MKKHDFCMLSLAIGSLSMLASCATGVGGDKRYRHSSAFREALANTDSFTDCIAFRGKYADGKIITGYFNQASVDGYMVGQSDGFGHSGSYVYSAQTGILKKTETIEEQSWQLDPTSIHTPLDLVQAWSRADSFEISITSNDFFPFVKKLLQGKGEDLYVGVSTAFNWIHARYSEEEWNAMTQEKAEWQTFLRDFETYDAWVERSTKQGQLYEAGIIYSKSAATGEKALRAGLYFGSFAFNYKECNITFRDDGTSFFETRYI